MLTMLSDGTPFGQKDRLEYQEQIGFGVQSKIQDVASRSFGRKPLTTQQDGFQDHWILGENHPQKDDRKQQANSGVA